jgi:predicted anti-sigma-YlaC factor YlaD
MAALFTCFYAVSRCLEVSDVCGHVVVGDTLSIDHSVINNKCGKMFEVCKPRGPSGLDKAYRFAISIDVKRLNASRRYRRSNLAHASTVVAHLALVEA